MIGALSAEIAHEVALNLGPVSPPLVIGVVASPRSVEAQILHERTASNDGDQNRALHSQYASFSKADGHACSIGRQGIGSHVLDVLESKRHDSCFGGPTPISRIRFCAMYAFVGWFPSVRSII